MKTSSCLLVAVSCVILASCNAAVPSRSTSRAAADDAALFMATVRVLRDSSGPSILVAPEPLDNADVGFLHPTRRLLIRRRREEWLRSEGLDPNPPSYEPCVGIFVLNEDRRKQGCPTSHTEIARVSPVARFGTLRVLEVSVRSLGPAGSSDERSRYVFRRRGGEWTLMARERGVIIE